MPKLQEVATIVTGLTLRQRTADQFGGSIRLLQLGDVDPSGAISLDNLPAAAPDLVSDRLVARAGDLVFRPRGAGIAVGVMPEHTGKVLVVSPLILIQPNRDIVDPGFLAWSIRGPRAQRHFAAHARGTTIVGIGKRDLEELEIDLPSLDVQRKIAAIVALQQAEADLLERLRTVRAQLIDALLWDEVLKLNR